MVLSQYLILTGLSVCLQFSLVSFMYYLTIFFRSPILLILFWLIVQISLLRNRGNGLPMQIESVRVQRHHAGG